MWSNARDQTIVDLLSLHEHHLRCRLNFVLANSNLLSKNSWSFAFLLRRCNIQSIFFNPDIYKGSFVVYLRNSYLLKLNLSSEISFRPLALKCLQFNIKYYTELGSSYLVLAQRTLAEHNSLLDSIDLNLISFRHQSSDMVYLSQVFFDFKIKNKELLSSLIRVHTSYLTISACYFKLASLERIYLSNLLIFKSEQDVKAFSSIYLSKTNSFGSRLFSGTNDVSFNREG